ncbi:hypothetical protein ABZ135_31445 [Streptomyces sp. NPDC006339]|uniref:DNA-3-methyladenine glycosylase family protein n=1 Tax=Streptomyces sp. NPDC006339 TaxID=3156755 RepID=UPI0033B1C908
MPTIRRLEHADTLPLPVTGSGPFDFRHTFWKPSHYPTALEAHTADRSWRTFRIDDLVLGVAVRQEDDRTLVADVHTDGEYKPEHRDRLRRRLIASYGLDEDLAAFHDLATGVPLMNAPLAALAGMRQSCPEDFFEISVIATLLQNTTIARSEQMTRSLLTNYGHLVHFDGITLRAWFTPAEIADIPAATFRAVDRLGYRDKYLVALAAFFRDHTSEEVAAMPNRAEVLQQIKGVGPVTAAVFNSHASRDPSDYPVDVWSRRIYSQLLFGTDDQDEKTIRTRMSELFDGHAGTAALYLLEHQFVGAPVAPLLTPDAINTWNQALEETTR